MKLIAFFLASLLLSSFAQATDLRTGIPASFVAQFELYKSGLPVANTTYQLSGKDNHYSFQATTRLKGLLSLFSDKQIIETSVFQLSSSEYYPLSYQFQQTGDKAKSIKSTINSEDKTISTIINNQPPININFKQPPWDKLSILLALMTSANGHDDKLAFEVLDRGKIKNYDFIYAGIEEIELEEDEWKKTVLWKRQDNNKKTLFFLDPGRRYIPIKIEQFKNQELTATLWLKELIWNEDD